jgi:hypothetical protein
MEKDTTNKTCYNSTYKKLAVHCYADTFLVIENLVLRNYIRAERRQLLVAAKRYAACFDRTSNNDKLGAN